MKPSRQGRARTQFPTTRNCAVEIPTFEEFAGVSTTGVQWPKPRPGQTTFLIIVSPLPGKYELYKTDLALAFLAKGRTGTVGAPPTFRQAANAPQAPQH